jgi:hypothetical protein
LKFLKGKISPTSLSFEPTSLLLFSIILNHINPQNNIKLPEEPKA